MMNELTGANLTRHSCQPASIMWPRGSNFVPGTFSACTVWAVSSTAGTGEILINHSDNNVDSHWLDTQERLPSFLLGTFFFLFYLAFIKQWRKRNKRLLNIQTGSEPPCWWSQVAKRQKRKCKLGLKQRQRNLSCLCGPFLLTPIYSRTTIYWRTLWVFYFEGRSLSAES